ncbi:hypothetical protein [Komagataeibacter oboediens]|uniref:hypothetical protein n=1 Tax=Komagataeibacter oboediens TaxID=65958 RepID=UPI0015E88042|nr:hypothetical protein [Komagataeibacter oboediens]
MITFGFQARPEYFIPKTIEGHGPCGHDRTERKANNVDLCRFMIDFRQGRGKMRLPTFINAHRNMNDIMPMLDGIIDYG